MMIFHRLGLVNKNQRGFTLIEMIIALVIISLIGGATTTAIFQMLNISNVSTNHMTAVKQVQNAVNWISRDAQMSQIVVPNGDSGFPLNLTWVEWDNTVHQVTYTVEDSKLQRNYYVNGGEPSEALVARFIDPDLAMTNCQYVGGVLTFKITATVDSGSQVASDTRVCEVIPRPGLE